MAKKKGCPAKKAAIKKARTPRARGKALAAYMKAGCAPRRRRKSSRKRRSHRKGKR